MHCTNATNSNPSCQGCRIRFSVVDISKIAELEWCTYSVSSFAQKYEETKFIAVKSGRKFAGSAWGSFRDPKDRWGFEFTIRHGSATVS